MRAKAPKQRDYIFRRLTGNSDGWQIDYDHVGLLADGRLHNPNGYPEAELRPLVEAAIERHIQRRQASARKAVQTRGKRHALKVSRIATAILARRPLGPSHYCKLCRKDITDPESVELGIGPECWQRVLRDVERLKSEPVDEPK